MDKDDLLGRLAEAKIEVSSVDRLGNDTGWRIQMQSGAIVNCFDTGKINIQGKNTEQVRALLDNADIKNVWRAPFASGFHTVVCPVCVNVSGLRVTPRPRWRSARPGPNKSPGVDAPFFEPGFQDAGRLSGHLAFHHPQTSKAD
jgi:hypothetical protein